jgi:hypothetical protein
MRARSSFPVCGASGCHPCCSKSSMSGANRSMPFDTRHPCSIQTAKGDIPFAVLRSGLAPARSSIAAISVSPHSSAQTSGVLPVQSFISRSSHSASGSTPACSRASSASRSLFRSAWKRFIPPVSIVSSSNGSSPESRAPTHLAPPSMARSNARRPAEFFSSGSICPLWSSSAAVA